jgi:hypothetical protein
VHQIRLGVGLLTGEAVDGIDTRPHPNGRRLEPKHKSRYHRIQRKDHLRGLTTHGASPIHLTGVVTV